MRQALYASKICSYAQGFVQTGGGGQEHEWPLNYGNIAMLWRGGCIIRARFLDRIKEAFDADPKLENLLLAPYFTEAVDEAQAGLAARRGDGGRAGHSGAGVHDGPDLFRRLSAASRLPANLLQAQRDYFGAHTYQRTDSPGTFHTDWIRLRQELGTRG